jgi:hypothetical protein
VPNSVPSSSSTLLRECQICKGRDHIAMTCPRLNEPQPKCAKCGMPHRTENYGVKCSFCSGLGHSKDKCWKKSKDGHSGAANFLEVLLNDEAATLQQFNELCGDENVFSYTHVPRRRLPDALPSPGVNPLEGSPIWSCGIGTRKGAPDFQHYEGVEGSARSPGIRLGRRTSRSSLILHLKQTTKWLVYIREHLWVLGQATMTHSQVPGWTHSRVHQSVVAESWDSEGALGFQL